MSLAAEDRPAAAKDIVLALPTEEKVVVWFVNRGGRIDHSVEAGKVTFMWVPWFVPNARPDGQDFEHNAELTKIVSRRMFRVAESIGDQSDADLLARVDLGMTTAADAAERAESIVSALINVSIHWSQGVRPLLAQTVVMRNGQVGSTSWQTNVSAPADDYYGRKSRQKR